MVGESVVRGRAPARRVFAPGLPSSRCSRLIIWPRVEVGNPRPATTGAEFIKPPDGVAETRLPWRSATQRCTVSLKKTRKFNTSAQIMPSTSTGPRSCNYRLKSMDTFAGLLTSCGSDPNGPRSTMSGFRTRLPVRRRGARAAQPRRRSSRPPLPPSPRRPPPADRGPCVPAQVAA